MEASPVAPSTAVQVRAGLRFCLKWIGIPLVAVLVIGTVANVALGIWAERSVRALNRDLAPRPPALAVVCSGEVSPGCASDAAQRAERTVAWVPAGAGRTSRWFMVMRRAAETGPIGEGRILQELQYGDVGVDLATNPRDELNGMTLVRSVKAAGVDGRLYRSNEPGSVSIVWDHAGEHYTVSASLLSFRRDWKEEEAAAVAAFGAIRYERPAPAA